MLGPSLAALADGSGQRTGQSAENGRAQAVLYSAATARSRSERVSVAASADVDVAGPVAIGSASFDFYGDFRLQMAPVSPVVFVTVGRFKGTAAAPVSFNAVGMDVVVADPDAEKVGTYRVRNMGVARADFEFHIAGE